MLCFHSFTIEAVVGIDSVAFEASCFEAAEPPSGVFAKAPHQVAGCRRIYRNEFHPDAVDHS